MYADPRDRHSIMAIYPFELFETDAAQNSTAAETTRHGLLIEGVPGGGGSLRVVRVTKSIGDPPEEPEAFFICPYMGRAYGFFALRGGEKGAIEEKENIFDPHVEEYDAFIDAVIAAAKQFKPIAPPHHGRFSAGFRGRSPIER
jgi:hypothetical protein